MKSIEERAEASWRERYPEGSELYKDAQIDGYIQGAKEQKDIDKELIEMLINELYTSRAYHLGITGLDSDEEIKRKTIENDCALVRGIDTTIKYVREAMEE